MMNIFKKIKIDFSTYFLLLIALFAGYIKNAFIILLIILIHEFGHVFFFLLFDINIENIVIYPYGGVTNVNKKLHERIYKDILISLGGITFQLILLILFKILYFKSIIALTTFNMFMTYNSSIIIFNLIPIIPLDGSKLFFAIFSKFFSFKNSYILMIITGLISLILFILYNFVYKLNDLILYTYLMYKLIEIIKEFKYIMNKFYLERIMYSHYYNEIINNISKIDKIRIDKYYYFKDNNRFINEKEYIKKVKY